MIALACCCDIRTSIQIELDMRVLLPLSGVVVRPSLHDLHILELEAGTGSLRDKQHADCNGGRDGESGRCEEAEDSLHADERRVHGCGGLEQLGYFSRESV